MELRSFQILDLKNTFIEIAELTSFENREVVLSVSGVFFLEFILLVADKRKVSVSVFLGWSNYLSLHPFELVKLFRLVLILVAYRSVLHPDNIEVLCPC